ncbi:MAG: hypothetical protein H6709_07925 [Kofleriaceae bacterium]|nr:hypothetical protein [Kofleriaceae bacterium]
MTTFEGVWSLPDGALRAFERRGEQVAMFRLDATAAPRTFERFFEFVPADAGEVAFVASEDHVDARAPEEPSCHVPLRAEYRFDLTTDRLERRQERAQISFDDGHCVLGAREWGDAVALHRERVGDGGSWVESSAGVGALEVSGADQDGAATSNASDDGAIAKDAPPPAKVPPAKVPPARPNPKAPPAKPKIKAPVGQVGAADAQQQKRNGDLPAGAAASDAQRGDAPPQAQAPPPAGNQVAPSPKVPGGDAPQAQVPAQQGVNPPTKQ